MTGRRLKVSTPLFLRSAIVLIFRRFFLNSTLPVNPRDCLDFSQTMESLLTFPQDVDMERYTVTVAPPGGESFRLLVPLAPTSLVSALAAEVKRRVARFETWADVPDFTLRMHILRSITPRSMSQ